MPVVTPSATRAASAWTRTASRSAAESGAGARLAQAGSRYAVGLTNTVRPSTTSVSTLISTPSTNDSAIQPPGRRSGTSAASRTTRVPRPPEPTAALSTIGRPRRSTRSAPASPSSASTTSAQRRPAARTARFMARLSLHRTAVSSAHPGCPSASRRWAAGTTARSASPTTAAGSSAAMASTWSSTSSKGASTTAASRAAVVRPGGVSTTAITGRPSRSAASSAPGRSPTETTGLTPCRSGRPPPRPRSTWGCPARGPGARRL